jgi:hypothetical protein
MNWRIAIATELVSLLAWAGGCAPGAGDVQAPRAGPPGSQDEGYTILLMVLAGSDHVNQALRYKQNTEADTGWKDLYVVHKEDRSELYRGNYPTSAAAQKDLRGTKQYRTKLKIQPYKQALVMPLPGKDVGPPRWNLAGTAGEFTLAIGLFKDDPSRGIIGHKQYAVDNVLEMRNQGLEAYFLHESSQSLVTIGSFPESSCPVVRGKDGTFERKVVDPKLQDLMRRFPYLAVNGYQEIVRVRTAKGRKSAATPSYLMAIPSGAKP